LIVALTIAAGHFAGILALDSLQVWWAIMGSADNFAIRKNIPAAENIEATLQYY
jgi:hypothetical protein